MHVFSSVLTNSERISSRRKPQHVRVVTDPDLHGNRDPKPHPISEAQARFERIAEPIAKSVSLEPAEDAAPGCAHASTGKVTWPLDLFATYSFTRARPACHHLTRWMPTLLNSAWPRRRRAHSHRATRLIKPPFREDFSRHAFIGDTCIYSHRCTLWIQSSGTSGGARAPPPTYRQGPGSLPVAPPRRVLNRTRRMEEASAPGNRNS